VLYVLDRYYLLSFGDPDYQPIPNDYNVATIRLAEAILDCLPFGR